MKGKLITLEGGEGSGKSTQVELIHTYLQINGKKSIMLREPGGTIISEQIRNIVLSKGNVEMDPLTELLLFMAARRQIVKHRIAPALHTGIWVICDRYTDSSIVYQGIARGIGVNTVLQLNNLVVEDTVPDLTFYLDVNIDIGLARTHKRGEMNRLDLEDNEFHTRVHEGYQSLYESHPERIVRINADKSVADVLHEIETYINVLL
jgi:dTMP kinase